MDGTFFPKNDYRLYLCHHGIKGQKWGVKNGPPYPIGSSPRKVFISGTSKIKLKDSGYYRKSLPKEITSKIDSYMKDNNHILIGDAPGIDTEVQKYLAKKGYRNVTVYTISEGKPRSYWDDGHLGWGIKNVKGTEQVDKDKAMSKDAHTGFAVILEDGAKATRNNIDRMRKDDKDVEVFTLFKDGNDMFTYTNPDRHAKQQINEIFDSMSTRDKKLLYPDWKSGQKLFGKDEFTKGGVAYSVVQSKDGKPFAFLMAGIQNWNGMRYGDIGLGVSSGYQGQGNANRMAKQLVDWYDKGNHDLDFLYWYARLDNPGSYKAALANGFQVEKQTDDMIFMRYPK